MTEKERIELADILFPNIKNTPDFYEKKYPSRNLKENQMVTRYGPSPTGEVHLGNLFSAFCDYIYAKQTGGVFFLRIEDTDKLREIENGKENIVNTLKEFKISPTEGYGFGGDYGPYMQSDRTEIYQTYVKDLVKKGYAYPCFMSEEDLDNIREEQKVAKMKIGIYGMYAQDRDLSLDEIKKHLDNNDEYVIRLKSIGDSKKTISFHDEIKGDISFPEYDMDIVLLKKDGTPTYHLAHAIDDHLMHTTHVIRGDEWVSSLPLHIQLFSILGFDLPKYAHIAPITIKDPETGNIRKISKRKDPWAGAKYYVENGIPFEALHLYLATILNSNFEEWYLKNQDKSITDFEFSFDKQAIGGTSFDESKLENICKTYFSRRKATDIYDELLNYTSKFDKEYNKLLIENKDKIIEYLNIEKDSDRPRKDIAKYSDVKREFSYAIYSEFEKENYSNLETDKVYDADLILDYVNNYLNLDLDNSDWFNEIKEFAYNNGYAKSPKEYKLEPDKYKGHVGDICEAIRVMITGKTKSPDLYSIMKIMKKDEIIKRVELYKKYISKKSN